jgi:hypothetical protein
MAFIASQANDTDIFCFQEIYEDMEKVNSTLRDTVRLTLLSDISRLLPGFDFSTSKSSAYNDSGELLTIFWRKGIRAKAGAVPVYRHGEDAVRLQHLQFDGKDKKRYTICNFHGYWSPKGKGDIQERFEQINNVNNFLEATPGEKIVCGDFNMLPGNRSFSPLRNSMKDLISLHGIKSTRSHFYTWPDKFADYVFVSPGIDVVRFAVLEDVVSDHLALLLEFS